MVRLLLLQAVYDFLLPVLAGVVVGVGLLGDVARVIPLEASSIEVLPILYQSPLVDIR